MHQTTVRFGSDTWSLLELEAARLGVSAAQYVRDSTLARLAYTAGREHAAAPDGPFAWADAELEALAARIDGDGESSAALRAQGEIARARAELREAAAAIREQRGAIPKLS